MKTQIVLLVLALTLLVTDCRKEDYGPQQKDKRSYSIVDFDRLEVGDAFDVTIIQGTLFSITASGDRRDLNDLVVQKTGSTLNINYASSEKRQYTVFIVVTMPAVEGMDFTGAVVVKATGFTAASDRFDVSLSGASAGQFEVNAKNLHVLLTGASEAHFTGAGNTIDASVSGASELTALNYSVDEAKLMVTGASKAIVRVATLLTVSASGASEVVYHGNPSVDSDTSGESSVHGD